MREPGLSLVEKRVPVLGLGDTGVSVARWVEREAAACASPTRAPRRREWRALRASAHRRVYLGSAGRRRSVCISPVSRSRSPSCAKRAQGHPGGRRHRAFAWKNAAGARHHRHERQDHGDRAHRTPSARRRRRLRGRREHRATGARRGPAAATPPAAWVLELSSYQLETTESPAGGRGDAQPHRGSSRPLREPRRIRRGEGAHLHRRRVQMLNRDDARSVAMALPGVARHLGPDAPPRDEDLGVVAANSCAAREILPLAELGIRGAHNVANALAACALVSALGAPFRRRPSRTSRPAASAQLVAHAAASSGTTTPRAQCRRDGRGAARLGASAVLILGGDGKGQDLPCSRTRSRATQPRCC